MAKRRIMTYCLLLLAVLVLALAAVAVGVGNTLARYENSTYWTTIVQPEEANLSSDCLYAGGQTVLLGEIAEDTDVDFSVWAKTECSGFVKVNVDPRYAEHLAVELEDLNGRTMDSSVMLTEDGTAFRLRLYPLDAAWELREELEIDIEVSVRTEREKLEGTFRLVLPAVAAEEEDPEAGGETDEDDEPTDPEGGGDNTGGSGESGEPTDPGAGGDNTGGSGESGEPTDPEAGGDNTGESGEPTDPEGGGENTGGSGESGEPTDPEGGGENTGGSGESGEPTNPENGGGDNTGSTDGSSGDADSSIDNNENMTLSVTAVSYDNTAADETGGGTDNAEGESTTSVEGSGTTDETGGNNESAEPGEGSGTTGETGDNNKSSESVESGETAGDSVTEEPEPEFLGTMQGMLSTVSEFSLKALLPLGIDVPDGCTRLTLSLFSDELPAYTRYSLDNGESWYMLYYGGAVEVEGDAVRRLPAGREGYCILLDLSGTEFTENKPLCFYAEAYTEDGYYADDALSTGLAMVTSTRNMRVPLILRENGVLAFPVTESWSSEAGLEMRLERLVSGALEETAEAQELQENAVIEFAAVTDDSIHVELDADSVTITAGETRPMAGTYRLTMIYNYNGVDFARSEVVFFVNYSEG